MAVLNEEKITEKAIIDIAEKMVIAGRTAPKGRGLNFLEIKIVTGPEIKVISKEMKKLGKLKNQPHFIRDSENILLAKAIVLFGSKINRINLDCGLCGFKTCHEKNPDTPCVFNMIDLGIALGSAASTAAFLKADNRIMFTVGLAVRNLKIFAEDIKIIYGIPITSLSKNPFFDRK